MRSRGLFKKAVVVAESDTEVEKTAGWFTRCFVYVAQTIINRLPIKRDTSLSLARQLSFR